MNTPLPNSTPDAPIHALESQSLQGTQGGTQPEGDTRFRVRPLKMLGDQMDVLLKGSGNCRLGDWLQLTPAENEPTRNETVFGVIIGLKAKGKPPGKKSGKNTTSPDRLMLVRIRVVHGKPGLTLSRASCLAPENLSESLSESLRESLSNGQSFSLGFCDTSFQPDARLLGHLTLVQGGRFADQVSVTAGLIAGLSRRQPVCIVDPTGQLAHNKQLTTQLNSQQLSVLEAGRDIHLAMDDDLRGGYLWAESPYEPLQLGDCLTHPVTVIDISTAAPGEKADFYDLIAESLLQPVGSGTTPDTQAPLPVLLYPEQFMADTADWVRQAYAVGLTPLLTTSPYADATLAQQAANRFRIDLDQTVWLQGDLTHGLPVAFHLRQPVPPPPPVDLTPAPAQSQAAPNRFAPELKQSEPFSPDAGEALAMLFPEGRERGIVIDDATPPSPAPPEADHYDSVVGLSRLPASAEPATTLPVSEPAEVVSQAEVSQPETEAGPDAFDDLSFDLDLDIKLYGQEDWYAPVDIPDLPAGITPPAESLHVAPYPASGAHATDASLSTADESAAPYAMFDDVPTPDWDGFDDPVVMPGAQADQTGQADQTENIPAEAPQVDSPPEASMEDWAEENADDTPPQAAAQQEPSAEAEQNVAFAAGDHVQHDAYGIGVVTKVIPMDGHEVLNITFESVGKRIMDPSIARLTKL